MYFDKHRPLVLRSLNQLEERLDAQRFFRANRRQIVNLEQIVQVDPDGPGGQLVLVLQGGERIEIARRRAPEFRARTSL